MTSQSIDWSFLIIPDDKKKPMNLFQNFLFRLSILLVFTPYLSSGATINHETDVTGIKEVPNQSRSSEFRAVWIATINNIDWPSNSNLPVEAQKGEFLRLLDTFQKFNLNVVILQVRAASDAFYESKSEPWSHFSYRKTRQSPQALL